METRCPRSAGCDSAPRDHHLGIPSCSRDARGCRRDLHPATATVTSTARASASAKGATQSKKRNHGENNSRSNTDVHSATPAAAAERLAKRLVMIRFRIKYDAQKSRRSASEEKGNLRRTSRMRESYTLTELEASTIITLPRKT